MKRLFFVFLIILCIIAGAVGGLYYRSGNLLLLQAYTHRQMQPVKNIPLSIHIAAIHLQASVESVGLDNKHNMDVPKNTHDVAWYNLGVQPGQIGNAVIDGHVDTPTGAPAVFAQLKNLHKGDSIDVTETNNITHEFVVTSIENLPTATFPVNRIFGSATNAHLNLITCSGVWNDSTSNYSQRLVVFTNLVK